MSITAKILGFKKTINNDIEMSVEYTKPNDEKIIAPYIMSYERIMGRTTQELLDKCKHEMEYRCDRYAENHLNEKAVNYCNSIAETEKSKWLTTKGNKVDDIITNQLNQFIGTTIEKNDITMKILETGAIVTNQQFPFSYYKQQPTPYFGNVVKEIKIDLNGNVTEETI